MVKKCKLVSALLGISLVGYGASLIAEMRFGHALPEKVIKEHSTLYRDVSTVVWEVGKGVRIEARLQRIDRSSASASLTEAPSRLVIRNLTANKTIYEQDSEDIPISMCALDDLGDIGKAVVLRWAGGSAERLEILAVSESNARVVLYESYRVSASLIDLGNNAPDVFITTGDSGAGPFYTTRYMWQRDRYLPVGRVRYENFIRTINEQFSSRLRSSMNPSN